MQVFLEEADLGGSNLQRVDNILATEDVPDAWGGILIGSNSAAWYRST